MRIQHHRQPTSTLETRNKSTGVYEHAIQNCSPDSPLKPGPSTEGHHLSYADWLHQNALAES